MQNELFTLATLAAFPGLVIADWTIVQFTKGLVDALVKWASKGQVRIKTRGWAYLVAVFLLFLTTYFQGLLSPLTMFLNVINAFFVAMAAMKVHESAAESGTIGNISSINTSVVTASTGAAECSLKCLEEEKPLRE